MSDSRLVTLPASVPSKSSPLCPACLVGSGRVYRVTVGTGLRTLAYVCEQCQHDWTVAEYDPREPFLSL